MQLLLHRINIHMSHLRVVPIEDFRQLFERRSAGLHVEEVNEEELYEDPDGIDEGEVVVVGKIVPGDCVGVAIYC